MFKLTYQTQHNHFVVSRCPNRAESYRLYIVEGTQIYQSKVFDDPLAAIQAVLTQQTGHKAWDQSETSHIPATMYDIGNWSVEAADSRLEEDAFKWPSEKAVVGETP